VKEATDNCLLSFEDPYKQLKTHFFVPVWHEEQLVHLFSDDPHQTNASDRYNISLFFKILPFRHTFNIYFHAAACLFVRKAVQAGDGCKKKGTGHKLPLNRHFQERFLFNIKRRLLIHVSPFKTIPPHKH